MNKPAITVEGVGPSRGLRSVNRPDWPVLLRFSGLPNVFKAGTPAGTHPRT